MTTATTVTQSEATIDLSNIVLLSHSFTGCGGSRTIKNGKILVEDTEIDAQGITSSKLQWFPTEFLSFKDKHNKRIDRFFADKGIATPLGPVISRDMLEEAERFLADTTSQFFDDVDDCVARYDITLQKHADKAVQKNGNPKVGQLIKMVALSAEEFKSTFKVVSVPPLVLSTTTDEGATELQSLLNDAALEKLQTTAYKLFYKSFFNKEKTTPTATTKTSELMDMVYNLSFANPKLSMVAEQFAELMDSVVPGTEVVGQTFYALKSFVQSLTTEQSLMELLDPSLVQVEDEEEDQTTSTPALGVTKLAKASQLSRSTTSQDIVETDNTVTLTMPVNQSVTAFDGLTSHFGMTPFTSTFPAQDSPVEIIDDREDALEAVEEEVAELAASETTETLPETMPVTRQGPITQSASVHKRVGGFGQF